MVEFHGWDASVRQWHSLTLPSPRISAITVPRRLLTLSGSWYGRLRASISGEPELSFCACAHDLGDAGLGVLDLDGTEGGPLQFVLVVPGSRRQNVRAELAFEFVSFVRFLEGSKDLGAGMALYDYIDEALKAGSGSIVFSVESRPLLPELQLLLAQQAERLAFGILLALERDAPAQGVSAAAD